VVILGPIFPYIWCHDSGWVSPQILVGPQFQFTPSPSWGRDWPGLILPIALAHIQHQTSWWVHTPLLGSHCGLSLWCLWGFNISHFLSSLGLRRWERSPYLPQAWVYSCCPWPSQAALQEKPGARWPIASTGLFGLQTTWTQRWLGHVSFAFSRIFVLREDAPQNIISSSPILGPGPS
jgi:hypothetical protein